MKPNSLHLKFSTVLKVICCRSLWRAVAGHYNFWIKGERNGFSLIEVIIAMALMSVAMLGLAGLLVVLGNSEAENQWTTKALFCAQEEMEYLKFEIATEGYSAIEGEEIFQDGPYKGMGISRRVHPFETVDGLAEIVVECSFLWQGSDKKKILQTLVFYDSP